MSILLRSAGPNPRLALGRIAALAASVALLGAQCPSFAVLSFTVEANGWPNTAHRNAAVAALQSTVNRYNAYGDFGNYNIYAYYNAGIPTAQASYLGSIGYGGTYPNERVTMHEAAHYLGSGTYGTPWDGSRGEALIDQFDGLEATLNGDSQHFWPYGLNYDSEGSEINKQRQVALMYAQRADMGIGSTASPSSATAVTMTASDALGESGFNYASTWSNTHFPQPGTTYATGNFTLRTPASGNSFTFAGESVFVNNTNGVNGGLLYKGTGSTGVVSFKNLNVSGGYVRHASGSGDVFRLAGKVTLTSSSTFDAAQGNITVAADVGGSGSLNKGGIYTLNLTGSANYTGNTTISAGAIRLASVSPIASYTFDNVSGSSVPNTGSGGAAMNGTLAGGASIVTGGQTGNAVSLSGGASVDINNGITDLGRFNNWTVSAWVKTTSAGGSILTKNNGSGWSDGNTIFYLGDGTAGGSGGIPSSVRYAGGFFQGAAGTRSVTDGVWHQVTYVNGAGNFAIYVDGVAQSLSSGNSAFGRFDIGSMVRLGASSNTVAGDGTLNFNGLLDNVQFYAHALTPTQVAALFGGGTVFGSLPSATNLTIASGASLDLAGATQQIGSLSGVSGAVVILGSNGRLIVNSGLDSTFAGTIAGNSGSIVKGGSGTLTLSGPNTYTGSTIVQGGTLVIGNSAQNPILSATAAGADIQAGTLVFSYAGGSSPAATVLSILDAGYDQAVPFSTGRLRSTTLAAEHVLGWVDDAAIQTLTIRSTIAGDVNLDQAVNFDDLLLLAQNYDGTSKVWGEGDTNYDGSTNFDDLLALAQHYGLNASQANGSPLSAEVFAADWALAQALAPEPMLLGVLPLLMTRRRVR